MNNISYFEKVFIIDESNILIPNSFIKSVLILATPYLLSHVFEYVPHNGAVSVAVIATIPLFFIDLAAESKSILVIQMDLYL